MCAMYSGSKWPRIMMSGAAILVTVLEVMGTGGLGRDNTVFKTV